MDSTITSHFSAVAPLHVKEGELRLYLVLYNTRRGSKPLEIRLIGGCQVGNEDPLETAERELGQEAGLKPSFDLGAAFLEVMSVDRPDLSVQGGLHRKYAFITLDPKEASELRINETDIEGILDYPLIDVARHLAREFPLPVGHAVRQPFHKKALKAIIVEVARQSVDPALSKFCREVGWIQ